MRRPWEAHAKRMHLHLSTYPTPCGSWVETINLEAYAGQLRMRHAWVR